MLWARVRVGDEVLEATLEPKGGGSWRVTFDGEAFEVAPGEVRGLVEVLDVGRRQANGAGTGGPARTVKAPMAGRLDRVAVQVGQDVRAGEVLFVLEAMKMQNEVRSPAAGKVHAVKAAAGTTLEAGAVVLELA